MSNELVVRKQHDLTPQTWEMILAMAPAMHVSRFFGVSSPEQAAAIMVKGYELGLGLAASFEFIAVIKNKPTLVPKGALALIQSSPRCSGIKIEDIKDDKGNPERCRVWMKRDSGFEYTAEFSMDDAKRAGLVKPGGGWESYPANMLRWRAIGFCADVVFPDLLGGLKRADELGAELTTDGDVIEGRWSEVPQPMASSESTVEPQQTVTLDQLIEEHGAEAILAANNGTIPATTEDLVAVAGKLNGGA